MFIAALLTIARTWKHPNGPSTDDWIRMKWYIYTMEYYSAIKKNKMMPFAATWMELENLILSEMSQRDKDKYHMISLISGISYTEQMKLSTEKKIMGLVNRLLLPGGKGREWEGLGA